MISTWLMPFFYQSSSIGDVNTTLQTIKDVGIALFALVIVALGIIAFITVNRRNVNSEVVMALRKVVDDYRSIIEDYKKGRDEAEHIRDTQQTEFTQGLTIIGDAHNRLADILAKMEMRQRTEDEANTKRDMLLGVMREDLSKIVADTPLMPHLDAIKSALVKIEERLSYVPSHDDIKTIAEEMKAIREILRLDVNEIVEKRMAAERITHNIENTHLTEDIPEPIPQQTEPREGNEEKP